MKIENDDAVSLHDVTFTEEGGIGEVFDRETSILYTPEGQKKIDGLDESANKEKETDKGGKGGQGGNGGGAGEEQEVEIDSIADLVVNKLMGNKVEFPPNMTMEEQAKVVHQSFNDVINHYERQIHELKNTGAGLTAYEQELISALRAGKPIDEFLSPITTEIDLDDKDSVVKYHIHSQNPEWDAKEVDEELEQIKSRNALDRYYKTAKNNLEQLQKDFAGSGKNNYENQLKAREEADLKEWEKDVNEIKGVFEQYDMLYGFKMDEQMRALSFRYATEINPQTQQTRLMDALASPKGVAQLAYLSLFGEQMIQVMKTDAYKSGMRELMDKLNKDPEHTRKNGTGNEFSNNKGEMQYDLDKLSEVTFLGRQD